MNASGLTVAGALAPGTRLLEYRIERVLGTGGFGITYAAYDPHLRKTVAIKEYLPAELAVRQDQHTVTVRSDQSRAAFNWGREQFIKEARLVALFNHPNLIHVYRFFEANETAYFSMDYAEGTTLEEVLKRQGTLSESAIKAALFPILDGLREVHRARILHRDIKPSNIILRRDGMPVLIDFGSARHNVGSMTRSIMSVVTAGYAPIEQYAVDGHQGPWTDIYAAGAVCYRALSGRRPLDSVSRIRRDPLTPAVVAGRGKYSPHFLRAVDWALCVSPEERPVGIADWRQALEGNLWPPARRKSAGRPMPAPPWPVTLDGPESDETQVVSDEPEQELTLRLAPVHDTPPTEVAPRTEVVKLENLRLPPPSQRPSQRVFRQEEATSSSAPYQPKDAPTSPERPRYWVVLGMLALLGLIALWGLRTERLAIPWGQGVAVPETQLPPPPRVTPTQRVSAETQPATSAAAPAPPAQPLRPSSSMPPFSVFRDCEGCPVMVVLPAGNFLMGTGATEAGSDGSERPAHRVSLPRNFAMSQFEVTTGQWQSCADAGICAPVIAVDRTRASLPVVQVAYSEVLAFADWLSGVTGRRYRLPSEAEWEYAARAGSSAAHYWSAGGASQCQHANGADPGGDEAGGSCSDGHVRRAPVGSLLANPYGLFDISGNVWEWTAECWRSDYAEATDDVRAFDLPDCRRRVVRGGSFRSGSAQLRSGSRNWREAGAREDDLGFRLVAE